MQLYKYNYIVDKNYTKHLEARYVDVHFECCRFTLV